MAKKIKLKNYFKKSEWIITIWEQPVPRQCCFQGQLRRGRSSGGWTQQRPAPWDPGAPTGGNGKWLPALFSALLLSFPISHYLPHPLAPPSPWTSTGRLRQGPGLPRLFVLLPERSQCPSEGSHLGSSRTLLRPTAPGPISR